MLKKQALINYQQGAGPPQHQVQSGELGQQDHRRETPSGERSF